MDKNRHLQRQLDMKRSLLDQGYLDEQFIQLEELQDDDNPDFVEETVTTFYNNSARFLQNIEHTLGDCPIDFPKLDNYMHHFKGSSSSIGATRVKNECTRFIEYCQAANAQGCVRTFLQVKQEHAILKAKLETYFQMAKSRIAAGAPSLCRSKNTSFAEFASYRKYKLFRKSDIVYRYLK
ncbi:Histidine-containing phosphotransfer protein 4 [Morella rubra]|uniref:Histidine-containing phosphotransfer protein n=1 Tax=Morella rubra TaxID=262757 RepID=A0A6A1UVA2_9ROSI|nr:Histidine-containing phosphotransfer protein 4 [Morella rubra]